MNDTELDDMLEQWKAPEPRAELRERVRRQQPRKWSFAWPAWHLSKGLAAGALVGAAICFIGIAAAFPQVLAPAARFNLLSEYVDHEDDGSSIIREYRASTAHNGQEIILERSNPDNWLMNLHFLLFDNVHRLLGISEAAPASMASDCSFPSMSVIGYEMTLNYRTTVQRTVNGDGSRYTEWRSPDLDCIVMKYIADKPAASGQFQMTKERRPMAVRINHPQ